MSTNQWLGLIGVIGLVLILIGIVVSISNFIGTALCIVGFVVCWNAFFWWWFMGLDIDR